MSDHREAIAERQRYKASLLLIVEMVADLLEREGLFAAAQELRQTVVLEQSWQLTTHS